jgi:hypothetical protein
MNGSICSSLFLGFIKDCDIRLWHIENCDDIKQVIEQNERLKNVKTANVSWKIN